MFLTYWILDPDISWSKISAPDPENKFYTLVVHIWFKEHVFKADCNLQATWYFKRNICFKECCNEHQPLHIFTAISNVNHTLHIVWESGVLTEILDDWTKAEHFPDGNCTSSERNTACSGECSICCRDTGSLNRLHNLHDQIHCIINWHMQIVWSCLWKCIKGRSLGGR